jgi:carbamate kinase
VIRFSRARYCVIACGGGIPVIQDLSGQLKGVEAVIDKDLASSARRFDVLVVSTGVEGNIDFNKPRALARPDDARERTTRGGPIRQRQHGSEDPALVSVSRGRQPC